MALWNLVQKTDPAHTKKVKFGRGFTAIDPHSQVMNATKVFGPAGDGWGWTVLRVEYTPTNDIAILGGLWVKEHWIPHENPGIQQWGQASLFIDAAESKKDTDAFKKAMTDGLTKCLSYLGFNADVFLGKFDDNKYVQDTNNEFRKAESIDSPALQQALAKADVIIKNIEACESKEEVEELRTNVKVTFEEVKNADKGQAMRMSAAMQKKLSEFPDVTA